MDYENYPPDWKTDIRPRILKRAKNKCEFCHVPNYACGYRDENGTFEATVGNEHHDKAGQGLLLYNEAKELIDHCNNWCDDKMIMIVLTIAHLDHDEDNWDVKDERLAALCQRCHLNYDREDNKKRKAESKYKDSIFPYKYEK